MKIITQNIVLFIALIILPLTVFGQTKSITRQSYESALNQAETKTDKQIRKEISIQKLYANGEITTTLTSTSEYLPPDKSRWLAIEDRGYSVKRTEGFNIGKL